MERLQRGLIAVIGFVTGACTTQPDVVATIRSDAASGLTGVTPVNGCYPGLYRGNFNNSTKEDARSLFPVTGEIEFSLVVANSGEYVLVETGAKLSGTSDQGNVISADIDTNVDGGGGGCHEGQFKVELTNGKIYAEGTDAAGGLDFYGTVEGSYKAREKNFFGTWKTFSPLVSSKTPVSQGDWQALWHAPK